MKVTNTYEVNGRLVEIGTIPARRSHRQRESYSLFCARIDGAMVYSGRSERTRELVVAQRTAS